MGGEVGVTSEVGVGSTFWVTIDLEAVAMQPKVEMLGRDRRILIVDDNERSRDSLQKKLKTFGFQTTAAAGVDAAWESLIRDSPPDLVLADEWMPQKGGLALLAALRSDRRFATLPFVLLSLLGADRSKDAEHWKPNAVVFKPTRSFVLATTVNDVLRNPTQHSARRATPAPASVGFAGARILLVEDNPVNQLVARRILQALAIEVTLANNGREALQHLSTERFDLILMDCHMPIMDGFATTRAIREEEARHGGAKRLPIIALTANVMSEDRELCVAAGMDGHVGKPIDAAQLAEYLKSFLTRAEPQVRSPPSATSALT
jgi:CheY-like chemotaxis protein